MRFGLKLAAFGFTALAVVATSRAPTPQTTFNVDLVTRNRTVLEVRALDPQSSPQQVMLRYDIVTAPDGGVVPPLVFTQAPTRPTTRGVQLALESTAVDGDLEALGTVSFGARTPSSGVVSSDSIVVGPSSVFLAFIRRGDDPVTIQATSTRLCDTCPPIIFDDITEKLE